MRCEICQKDCNGPKGLGLHLRKHHSVGPKEYYDKYLRKPDEGFCATCKSEIAFGSLGRGYVGKFCSHACQLEQINKNRLIVEKARIDSIPVENRVVCKICNAVWDGITSLGLHIHHSHQMSTKDYYDLHLKVNPKEGYCLECGKPLYFQDLGTGYPNKYCSLSCNKAESHRQRLQVLAVERERRKSEILRCSLCGLVLYGFKSLANHVRQRHNRTNQQYYDAFLATANEGVCKLCKKPTRFIGISKGYFDYCSIQCANQSAEHRACVSEAKSQIPSPLRGRPSHRKGKVLSFEHAENIRKAAMRRAEEHCRLYGHHFPTRGKGEVDFIETLQQVCEFAIDVDFRPAGYIVDGYIHELNLVIEYDESYHDAPAQQQKDEIRELNIKKAIQDVEFFRVKESEWKANQQQVMSDFIFYVEANI